VAVNLYVTTHLARIPMERTFTAVLPFVLTMLLGLLIIALFPDLSLVVPKWLGMLG